MGVAKFRSNGASDKDDQYAHVTSVTYRDFSTLENELHNNDSRKATRVDFLTKRTLPIFESAQDARPRFSNTDENPSATNRETVYRYSEPTASAFRKHFRSSTNSNDLFF